MRAEIDADEDGRALNDLLPPCTLTDEFREENEAASNCPLVNNAEQPTLEKGRAYVSNKPEVVT